MIYDNAFVSLGGTDLSAFVQSCTPSFDVELQDDTAMGDTTRSNAPGLEAWSFDITFLDPFAASGPDATVWPLRGTTFTIIFRPDAGSASATNPSYTGTGVIGPSTPIQGNVGDEGTATVSISSAGPLVRATA